MPPGGFESQPEAVRQMQLDNARTMPLLFSTPPLFVTCDRLKSSNAPMLIVLRGRVRTRRVGENRRGTPAHTSLTSSTCGRT